MLMLALLRREKREEKRREEKRREEKRREEKRKGSMTTFFSIKEKKLRLKNASTQPQQTLSPFS
jgi:hypothetical protein